MYRTTFVTAFIDLGETRTDPQAYLDQFMKLARTGIPIHLFVSYSYIPLLLCLQPFQNVYVDPINLEQLELYKALAQHRLPLPAQRTVAKDTRNFMILMNAKVELVDSAIRLNHFGTDQYAWIDFRIFHVLQGDEATAKDRIRELATLELKEPAVLIPGCWSKGLQGTNLFQSIHWRFCGGFFLGDAASLQSFYELYTEHFLETLLYREPNATLTWEVNFWHYLELHHGFNPIWYKGDHNTTILDVPASAFVSEPGHLKLPATLLTECGRTPEPETSNAL